MMKQLAMQADVSTGHVVVLWNGMKRKNRGGGLKARLDGHEGRGLLFVELIAFPRI